MDRSLFADVEIRTERLCLRQPLATDAERLQAIADDRRVARNLTSNFPHPYTADDADQFLASNPSGLAIFVDDGVSPGAGEGMVGLVGGSTRDPYEGVHHFGYWLGHDYWGHGYATEAGRAYLDHVIATERPRRIEAMVFDWNPASGRVLEKLGLSFEGRLAARLSRFGEVADELVYGMVVSDRSGE